MPDLELRRLRLFAPLRYQSIRPSDAGGFPFPSRPEPRAGDEELALYEPESVILPTTEDGPHAAPALPMPKVLASNLHADGGASDSKPDVELSPGVYGFLQGSASDEDELRALLDGFARQAWWERFEGQGPLIVRRVFEDGRWAVQVWRRAEKL